MDIIKKYIREVIYDLHNMTIEEITDNIYNDECNFNNADSTSEQIIYDKNIISSFVEFEIKKMISDNEICSKCKRVISGNDFIDNDGKIAYCCVCGNVKNLVNGQ